MVGKDHVSPIADRKAALDGGVPALHEIVEFGDEHMGIDHHALTKHTARGGSEDPARQQPHDELLVAHHQGVPRIRPARIAHDDVRELGIQVDDLSLAFVAPLGAHNDNR